MAKKKKHSKKPIILITVVLVIVIAAIGGYFLYTTLTKQENKEYSFILDTGKVTGWWTAGSYWPDPKDSQEITQDLPIVSMIAFEGQDEASIVDGKCFLSTSYYDTTIDIKAALLDREKGAKGDGSIIFEPIATMPMTMLTPNGEIKYDIHRYEFSGPGSETIQRGAQFAYVPLEKGHLALFGYCQEANQLSSTDTALKAIAFKKD